MFCFSYNPSSKEEVILIHVEFSGHLQDFHTHVEAEEQLVSLKQTATRVPARNKTKQNKEFRVTPLFYYVEMFI